jgi:enamine deaminase RidA (YjgF/YER057c/UK114 family)
MMDIIQPKGWKRPKGYSHAVRSRGDIVFVAGQVGWDAEQRMVGKTIVDQTRQALENIVAILREAGARPTDVARMTWYVKDLALYRSNTGEIGRVYREVMGTHYPAMTLVEVAGLVEDGALVEIEATAIIATR